jgi:DNA-binding NtrC family response regulator
VLDNFQNSSSISGSNPHSRETLSTVVNDLILKGYFMSNNSRGNGETVLIVDDSEIFRDFLVAALERANFNVLSTDSGPNAVALAAKTKGRIDLLLTDWDMPEMSGIALGQTLKLFRPDIHVMQMSGGSHDSMIVLNYGWAFLQKPFVAQKLIEMMNDVLHTPDRSQLGGESFDSRLDTNPTSPAAKDPDNHPAESNEPKDRGK